MEEKGELDHYIGVATTNECPNNFIQIDVPALTWAVFESVGPFPETLQDIWGVFIPNGSPLLITSQ